LHRRAPADGQLDVAVALPGREITVFPGIVVTGSLNAPAFDQDVDGNWHSGGALFEVPSVPVDRDLKADTVTARDRLIEAGWIIDENVHSALSADAVDIGPADAAWSFTAHTDGLVLDFGASRYNGRTSLGYDVRRTTYPHAPTMLLLTAGMVAGAAGWLAACSLYRRVGARRGRATVRVSPLIAVMDGQRRRRAAREYWPAYAAGRTPAARLTR
jgi:hypothetical protein